MLIYDRKSNMAFALASSQNHQLGATLISTVKLDGTVRVESSLGLLPCGLVFAWVAFCTAGTFLFTPKGIVGFTITLFL